MFRRAKLLLLIPTVGCSRPAAEPVVVEVPVPVVLTSPAEPPVPALAAVAPLSLGCRRAAWKPVPVTLPADSAGRLTEQLLRPTAPTLPRPAVPDPPPPETWLDRGHLPLPEVPPPVIPLPLPAPNPGSPTPPPGRVPADLGARYLPDFQKLTLPDRGPPAGLGEWLRGLAGGPLPALAGAVAPTR